ncbi:Uncharacterised protein [BD1-7 clade bacterium]|uniref:Roadblock/LAMTOR2 domain-containing protein n=1 Tax=BD1-7 clade bacterium TaxID=2029982 RepID=A0A5S9R1T8_9GAMM|nr:Uncharacterised protein [BD1-7 clade bacterium]
MTIATVNNQTFGDKRELVRQVNNYLRDFVQRHPSIDGALVVSVDGHLIAKSIDGADSTKRLASMGSSLMSLGNTVTGEMEMGLCKNVIVENEEGFITFMHINKKLVLVTFTTTPNGLGLLLSASRSCAERLLQELRKSAEPAS